MSKTQNTSSVRKSCASTLFSSRTIVMPVSPSVHPSRFGNSSEILLRFTSSLISVSRYPAPLLYGGGEWLKQLHRQGKYDGGIVFGGNGGQGLQISELQRRRRFVQHVGGFLQRPRGLLLSLGRDDFGSGISRGFGLGRHGALELHRQTNKLKVAPSVNDESIYSIKF